MNSSVLKALLYRTHMQNASMQVWNAELFPGGIASLAFDWTAENLFWGNSLHPSLRVIHPISKQRVILKDGVANPVSMCVDPGEGYSNSAFHSGL
jgi:hypothetical protein